MILHAIGMYMNHDRNFSIHRPKGSGDNLFILYKTEAYVYADGVRVHVCPGSCILYSQGADQHYAACTDRYVNHFVHFDSCDDAVFQALKLPVNTPVTLRNTEEIETILRLISREQISVSEQKAGNADLLLRLLCRKIAENQCDVCQVNTDSRHYEELTRLRSEMYGTPGKYHSVSELAKEVNISLSHFQALYRAHFSVSCYEDLLNAKITCGKNYLISSTLSVKEIATLCGYETDTCFMRSFKKMTGLTPSLYRMQRM